MKKMRKIMTTIPLTAALAVIIFGGKACFAGPLTVHAEENALDDPELPVYYGRDAWLDYCADPRNPVPMEIKEDRYSVIGSHFSSVTGETTYDYEMLRLCIFDETDYVVKYQIGKDKYLKKLPAVNTRAGNCVIWDFTGSQIGRQQKLGVFYPEYEREGIKHESQLRSIIFEEGIEMICCDIMLDNHTYDSLDIYVPQSCTVFQPAFIQGAEEGVQELSIHAVPGSPAQRYCDENINYTFVPEPPKLLDFELASEIFFYTGETVHPEPKVVIGGKTLVNGTDYTVTYSVGCIELGSYQVTVTGSSEYPGEVTKEFYILEGSDSGSESEEESDVEEEPENIGDGWCVENGRSYWYENGVKQGTVGRGKEIYDPSTNAWYWLDAASGGTIAKNKEVYMDSGAGVYADNPDGTGKWVRYDKDGHMVKGWYTNENATYYYDAWSGAMAKGTIVLEKAGKKTAYEFDTETGIKTGEFEVADDFKMFGWNVIDGVPYWFEEGVKQGVFGRGKETYDPDTDAWYWLDSVDGGKKAVSKDVYQESGAGPWGEKEGADGERYGKWVRYDKDGYMIKGWSAGTGEEAVRINSPDEGNGRPIYYFDWTYGTMAKGRVVIDGENYYFDEENGILKE